MLNHSRGLHALDCFWVNLLGGDSLHSSINHGLELGHAVIKVLTASHHQQQQCGCSAGRQFTTTPAATQRPSCLKSADAQLPAPPPCVTKYALRTCKHVAVLCEGGFLTSSSTTIESAFQGTPPPSPHPLRSYGTDTVQLTRLYWQYEYWYAC